MMENLPLILLLLACPIGMLLMGGVMWLMAKGGGLFRRNTAERPDSPTELNASH